MSWKDLNKSLYSISVTKFQEWVPSQPFSIIPDANKIRYSEGDEITSADNVVFNIEFTGVPLGPHHVPCGYWHKNYVPTIYEIYTSKIYPIYELDGLNISAGILGGSLDIMYLSYIIPPEGINFNVEITGGIFKTVYKYYTIPSEGLNFTATITGGIFDQIYYTYTIPSEGINLVGNITGGILDIILIQYSNWPPEQLIFSGNITGGTHVSV